MDEKKAASEVDWDGEQEYESNVVEVHIGVEDEEEDAHGPVDGEEVSDGGEDPDAYN